MRFRALLPALLATCVAHGTVSAVVRNVPGDHPTIQQALNVSTAGDIVRVAPGTYMEALLMGPAQNGVTLESVGGPLVTIVDANLAGTSVLVAIQVGPATRVTGFTFRRGGAVPLTFVEGGGMRLTESSPHIENNIFESNVAASGGAMYIDGGSPTIVNNIVRDNLAAHGSGGAFYCDHFASPRIENNLIVRNRCAAYGGGVTIWEGALPQIVGNTIADNEATLGGGGVFVTRNSHPQLSRNIVALNPVGGGIWVEDFESTVALSCNDVWGNVAFDYLGLTDPTGADGNLKADPLFCNADALDYHLRSDSPCAPAASPQGCDLIGALGVNCSPPTPATSATWGRVKAAYR